MERKKILAWLLSTAALLSLAGCKDKKTSESDSESTEGVVYQESEDGRYAIVSDYEGSSSVVRIAELYNGLPVTEIADFAFNSRNSVTEIVLPDSILTVGNFAFSNCLALQSVVFSEGVTSIGERAFFGCGSLTEIAFPTTVQSFGFNALGECEKLKKITLPFIGESKDGTENTHFGFLFGADEYLKNPQYVPQTLRSVTITNTASIDDWAFNECAMLEEVELPANITQIGHRTFYLCDSIDEIFIPATVVYVANYAFAYCYSITIYCEVAEKPFAWDDNWNYGFPVVWDCTSKN